MSYPTIRLTACGDKFAVIGVVRVAIKILCCCQKLSDVTYIDRQHVRLMDILSEADGSAVDILRCIRMSVQSTICISYRVSEATDRSSNSVYTSFTV